MKFLNQFKERFLPVFSKENRHTYGLVWVLIRQITRQGSYDFITTFKYGGQIKDFGFRTRIFLDADVVHYVSDISTFPNDTEWQALYQREHQRHHANIEKFIADLRIGTELWSKLVVLPFFLYINYSILRSIWTLLSSGKFDATTWSIIIELGIFVVMLLIGDRIASLVTAGLMKLVQWYMNRNSKGRRKKNVT